MNERAVRVHRQEEEQHHLSNRYLRLQQQRRAARDVPLCIPRLRLAWIAFGAGFCVVVVSLCLMIAGAASSGTVYGGKGSVNLSAVYAGVVLLIIGIALLIFFGIQFARVRNSQKEEHIRADTGHENAAFPVSGQPDAFPLTPTYSKEATAHGLTQPPLNESPKDSAYSSIAMGSVAGSELNVRRLSDANSQSPLTFNIAHNANYRPSSLQMGPSTATSATRAFPTSHSTTSTENSVSVSHGLQRPHSAYHQRPVSQAQSRVPGPVSYSSQSSHPSNPQRPVSQAKSRTPAQVQGNYPQHPLNSNATSGTELPTFSSRSAVVTVERHAQPSDKSSARRVTPAVTSAPVAINPMISTDPQSIQRMNDARNENRRRPMPTQSSSSLVI